MTDHDMVILYTNGLSTAQIAKLANCAQGTVWRRLTKTGLTLRSNAESVHLRNGHGSFIVTDKVVSLFDGLLLGDGYIERCGITARFSMSQSGHRIPWTESLQRDLKDQSIESHLCYEAGGEATIKGKNCIRQNKCQIRTAPYKELLLFWDRWYSSGVKRVPGDVVLDANSLAQWYMGDGTVGGKGYRVYFCTDGFYKEDVHFLADALRARYGWHVTVNKHNRLLMTRTQDRADFARLIEDYVHPCFSYKMQLKTTDLRYKSKPIKYCRGLRDCTKVISDRGQHCRSCAAEIRWLNEKSGSAPARKAGRPRKHSL